MGIHWLGYDVGLVGKVVRKAFVVTVKVNYMVYVETITPRYRVFWVITKQTYSVTTLTTDSQMLQLLQN